MTFLWTTIHVRNMEESLAFYQGLLGLEMNRRFKAGPGSEIAFLGSGETQLELIHNTRHKQVEIGEDISIGFKVESLDEMMQFVTWKGLALYDGPYQPSPDIRFFYMLDPNGVKVQIVEMNEE